MPVDRRMLRAELQRTRSFPDESPSSNANESRSTMSQPMSNNPTANASNAGTEDRQGNKVTKEGFTRARRRHGKYSHRISEKGKGKGAGKSKGKGKAEGSSSQEVPVAEWTQVLADEESHVCCEEEQIAAQDIPTAEIKDSKPVEVVPQCSTDGCSRETWNGKPGQSCCRTCMGTDGGVHGPDCERKFRTQDVSSAEQAPTKATPQCPTDGCTRETWNGKPGQTCCRTCSGTDGEVHGPDCERKFSLNPSSSQPAEAVAEEPLFSPRHGCLIDHLLSSAVQLPLPQEQVTEEPARLSPEEVERVFKENVPGVENFVYRFQDGNYSLQFLVKAYDSGVVKFKGTDLEDHFKYLMRKVVHYAEEGKPGCRGYLHEVAEAFMDCQDIQARAIEHVGFQISGMTLDFRSLLVQFVDDYKSMAMKFLLTTEIDKRGGPDDWRNDPVHFENRIVADIGARLGLNAADVRRALLDEHKDRNRPFKEDQQRALVRKFKAFFDFEVLLQSLVNEVNSFSEKSPKESLAKLFLDWISERMPEKHLVFDEETFTRLDITTAFAFGVLEKVFLGETKSQDDYRGQPICELLP